MLKKYTVTFLSMALFFMVVLIPVRQLDAAESSLDEVEKAQMNPAPGPMSSTPTIITLQSGAASHPSGPAVFSLDGTWELVEGGTEIDRLSGAPWTGSVNAQVPGSVHKALWDAGIIGDPTYAQNMWAAKDKSYSTFYMKRTFTKPTGMTGEKLRFGGIADSCKIWLNGTLLGTHQGMFGGPDYDVSSLLQANNTLIVKLDPAIDWHNTVVFNCVYGWHYADIPAKGIWKSIKIEGAPSVRLNAPFVTTIDAVNGVVDLYTKMEGSGGGWSGTLVGTIEPDNFSGSAYNFSYPVNSSGAINEIHLRFTVPNPQLWWPNDLGAQNLYRLKLSFIPSSGTSDYKETIFGLRTIQTQPLPGGPYSDKYNWQFVINGRPVFLKGTGWCTLDTLMRFDRSRYDRFLTLAQKQHIQLLRAWGGGMPETDDFYDLCSRKGILVYQEWPCCWDSEKTQPLSILEETVRLNVPRIRNYPSLLMYGGGNEGGGSNNPANDMLGRLSYELDGTRPYHRQDPWGGSAHNYDAWWGLAPIDRNLSLANETCFLGEFGLPSSPSYESVQKYMPPNEVDTWPNTPTFAMHTPLFTQDMVDRMVNYYSSKFIPQDSMKHFILGSQMVQTTGMRHTLEHARTRWPDAIGVCNYKLVDVFPGMSWSTVDWYGVPKIGYYFEQQSYKPLHACVLFSQLNPGGTAQSYPVYLLDDADELNGSWTVKVRAFDSSLNLIKSTDFNGSGAISRVSNLGNFTLTADQASTYPLMIVVELSQNGVLRDRTFYWQNYEEPHGCLFVLPPTTLSTVFNTGSITVTNTGNKPAVGVYFDCPTISDVFLADESYFWLDPGESKTVNVSHTSGVTVKMWNNLYTDNIPPTIKSCSIVSTTNLKVTFSEPVEKASAETASNYTINKDINISSASLGVDNKTVTLTVSVLTVNEAYTLTVNNVKDRALIPNTIAPNSTKQFVFGVIGEWKLDEGGGTTVADSSFNGHNGTVTGASWVEGKSCTALNFDGTANKYVNIPNADVNVGNNFTISAWVKHTQDRSSHRVILAKGQKDTGHFELYEYTGTGEISLYSPELGEIKSGITVDDGNWHHIVVTYDGSTMNFYKDTILGSSQDVFGTITDETETIRIGALVDGTFPYKGTIDEIKIYGYSFTAIQVQNLYNSYGRMVWYKMDENNGTSVEDSSGSGYNGSQTGASWVSGKSGSALSFSGSSSSYMQVSNFSANIGSSFTLYAWVKAAQGRGSYHVFLAKANKVSGHYELYIDPNGYFRFYSPDINDYGSNTIIDDNNWHQVAVTYNGSQMKFYVDGQLKNTVSASGTVAAKTDTFRLGTLVDGTFAYNGVLDDVRIYNYPLTDTDVSNLYTGGPIPNLVWYKMDENSGTSVEDSSGSGYSGSQTGASWVSGKSGSALSFSGSSSSYMQVSNFSANIGSSFTLYAWVKAVQGRGNYHVFLAKANKVSGHYELYIDPNGYFRFYSPDINDYGSNTIIDDNNWHQVAVTYNGSQMKFYVDGQLKNTVSASGTVAAKTDTFRLGTLVDGTFAYNGVLDDVRIYNYPLTDTVIQNLFDLGI